MKKLEAIIARLGTDSEIAASCSNMLERRKNIGVMVSPKRIEKGESITYNTADTDKRATIYKAPAEWEEINLLMSHPDNKVYLGLKAGLYEEDEHGVLKEVESLDSTMGAYILAATPIGKKAYDKDVVSGLTLEKVLTKEKPDIQLSMVLHLNKNNGHYDTVTVDEVLYSDFDTDKDDLVKFDPSILPPASAAQLVARAKALQEKETPDNDLLLLQLPNQLTGDSLMLRYMLIGLVYDKLIVSKGDENYQFDESHEVSGPFLDLSVDDLDISRVLEQYPEHRLTIFTYS